MGQSVGRRPKRIEGERGEIMRLRVVGMTRQDAPRVLQRHLRFVGGQIQLSSQKLGLAMVGIAGQYGRERFASAGFISLPPTTQGRLILGPIALLIEFGDDGFRPLLALRRDVGRLGRRWSGVAAERGEDLVGFDARAADDDGQTARDDQAAERRGTE